MNNIKKLTLNTKKLNLLYIEEHKNPESNLKDILELLFNNVIISYHEQEALDIYSNNFDTIDIIFTEIFIPTVLNFNFINEIRTINPLAYIVIITEKEDLQTYKNGFEIGINDIFSKPIVADKMIHLLQKAIKYIDYLKKTHNSSHLKSIARQTTTEDFLIDSLTNLNNKNNLDRYLKSQNSYHLILINIDNFDTINSNYGYNIGDEVIVKISELLENINKENSLLFRVISDEFAFLLSDTSQNEIESFVIKIIQTIENNTVTTNLENFNLTCTIGIGHGKGDDILRKAHIAIKETREIGKEKYGFYSNNSILQNKRDDNLKWLNKIKNVLQNDTIIPYYQAIINNRTNEIETYEALARVLEMNRVNKPYYYLENAKLFQMIPDITKVMISKVFQIVNTLKYSIAINITQEDLQSDEFISYILTCSKKYNVNTSNIVFEILESISTAQNDTIFKNLSLLNHLGYKIAIDDFGTNHTNMQKFSKIQIDYIKIDDYYIENLLNNPKIEKMVESMIKYAKSMDAKVIAESVSSKEIFEKVKQMGIEYSQGYYIGKPLERID